MRLHFSFISDALRVQYPLLKQVIGPSSDWHRRVGYPRVLQLEGSAGPFQAGDLILSDVEHLPADASALEGCSLICLGEAPAAFQEGSCDYVELSADVDVAEALACIRATYIRLEEWHDRVVNSMINGSGIDELYALYHELFDNPVYFTNEVHDMATYIEGPECADNPDIYHYLRGDYTDSEVRENLMHDVLVSPLYEATFKTEGPQLWSDDVVPFDSLYCNVLSNGTYAGRILVDERGRRFRISDYALIQMLHDDTASFLTGQSNLSADTKIDVWQHLLDILDGSSPDPEIIDRILSNAGWKDCNRFVCLVFRLDERDKTIGSGYVTSRLVEQAIPRSRAFLRSNAIVAIAPLEADASVRSVVSQDLLVVIRDNLMKVGVSNGFSELGNIRMHYDQACLALETGKNLRLTDWVLYCNDCLLPFMLLNCNGNLSLRTLCHSKLQMLMEYDREHNLEYTATLRGFLENNCNQADTCRALYLHRSTLIQRLRRITEITRFDLDDKDTRLYLLMYFAVQALRE